MSHKNPLTRLFSFQRPAKPDHGVTKRLLEVAAVGMIGDGLLAFIKPRHHVRLWDAGPKVWQDAIQPLEDHPEVTRWLGAAEAALGFWLAFQQIDDE